VILVFSKSLKQHKGGLFQTRGRENANFFDNLKVDKTLGVLLYGGDNDQFHARLFNADFQTETTLSSSTNSNNSQILAKPEIAPGEQYSVTLHKLNGSLGVSLIGNQSGDAGTVVAFKRF